MHTSSSTLIVIAAILVASLALNGILVWRVSAQARTRPTAPRIAPVEKAAWTDAQREILAPYEQSERLYNVFTTMAQHPALAKDWLVFGGYILSRSTLPPRDRELLILRIGWLCGSEYEWAQHVRLAKGIGFTDADVAALAKGPTDKHWSEFEANLLRAADELHADACITDATWNALAAKYSKEQMMDTVFTVGQYNLVSMALNSFGVQLDPGLTGFPGK